MSAVVAGGDETPCNHCCFPLCPATAEGAIQNSKITFTKSCLSSSFLLLPRSSHFCCRLFCLHWADPQTCCTVQHSCSSLSLSLSLSHTHTHTYTTNLRQLKTHNKSQATQNTQQILGNSNTQQLVFPLLAAACRGYHKPGMDQKLAQQYGHSAGTGQHWGCLQAYPTQWSAACLFFNI